MTDWFRACNSQEMVISFSRGKSHPNLLLD